MIEQWDVPTGASHLFLGAVCCAQGVNYFFMNLVVKVWLLLLFRAMLS